MIYLLHHLLRDTAQRHAERTAVVFGTARISYRDLDTISAKLASALRERGLRKGDRVGIYLQKSIFSVVSVFGILKAGGVYVPIDPNFPRGRFAHIIQDCGIRHLITSDHKLPDVAEVLTHLSGHLLDAVVLVGDAPRPEDPAPGGLPLISWDSVMGATPPERTVDGVDTDLGYLLYTSGSTGVPKGVMISHRAAFTFINWTHEYFQICEDDVVSNHAPLHFDLSIFDIFTTVKAGGSVVLVPERLSTFPVTLSQFIRDQRITVWYSVPSALVLMLVRGNFSKYAYPDLRLILFAGEVFPIKYLRALRQSTRARLFNLYGPTETNVCTAYEVGELPADRVAPVPIGTPIGNYEVFAVDGQGQPITPGAVGELYARGPGLMSGYWGDPEKTRRVLVPNRFQPHFEDIVCRTGDLVTLDEDGNYVYLGRGDHMIKSRGYRIELGEVETALYTHPKIVEAAVVGIPDEEVTNRLKAFIVCGQGATVTTKEIQEHCQARIPRYMVPEMIELRDSLPKTSTGKIDRSALLEEG